MHQLHAGPAADGHGEPGRADRCMPGTASFHVPLIGHVGVYLAFKTFTTTKLHESTSWMLAVWSMVN